MPFKNIGFIGAGRIVKIILEGLKNKNFNLESISTYDCSKEALDSILKAFPTVRIINTVEEVCNSELIILAIHPPVIMETLEKIKPLLWEKTIILSLAPKITISQIKGKLGGFGRIARCNPNLTSIVNKGYNPVCLSDEIGESEREEVVSLFNNIGKTPVVKEETLEAYAVISAMLPTYFWFMWDELFKLGLNFGLKEDKVREVLKEVIPASMDVYLKYGMDAYNLIPARPLKDDEEEIRNILRKKLVEVFLKLKN